MPEQENTKVRFSFTVEMGEVPSRIASLIREAECELQLAAHSAAELANALEKQEHTQLTFDGVDALRRDMRKTDIRLEDCQELLTSYQAALVQVNRRTAEQETEEQFKVVSESDE